MKRYKDSDYFATEDGRIWSSKRNKFLKGCVKKNGYRQHVLMYNGRKTIREHRIVAECYIEKQEGKEIVNHKDGNKLNNRADNLEWSNVRDNTIHAYKLGLSKGCNIPKCIGIENPKAKLSEEDVREIRKRSITGKSKSSELAKEFGVSMSTIQCIKARKIWKHLDE